MHRYPIFSIFFIADLNQSTRSQQAFFGRLHSKQTEVSNVPWRVQWAYEITDKSSKYFIRQKTNEAKFRWNIIVAIRCLARVRTGIIFVFIIYLLGKTSDLSLHSLGNAFLLFSKYSIEGGFFFSVNVSPLKWLRNIIIFDESFVTVITSSEVEMESIRQNGICIKQFIQQYFHRKVPEEYETCCRIEVWMKYKTGALHLLYHHRAHRIISVSKIQIINFVTHKQLISSLSDFLIWLISRNEHGAPCAATGN